MPAPKYTQDQFDEMAALRKQGLSHRAIGVRLGMSASAVSWHCLRLGADSPNTKTNLPANGGPMSCTRNGVFVRRFTKEEDRKLLGMEATGASVAQMAKQLGRRWNSTRGRLMTLARHQERAENQHQQKWT